VGGLSGHNKIPIHNHKPSLIFSRDDENTSQNSSSTSRIILKEFNMKNMWKFISASSIRNILLLFICSETFQVTRAFVRPANITAHFEDMIVLLEWSLLNINSTFTYHRWNTVYVDI
jgi:hypothetical protein